MNPQELLSFLHTAELLKRRMRHCWNPEGRRESVAEHCWRTALMADLLRSEFPEVDMDRVVSMCLWHDLGEAVTGDIPVFQKTGTDEKREELVIAELLSDIPQPQKSRLEQLFAEMLQLQTPEAKLYKSLDKLEALISHNEAELDSWLPLEYDLQLTYGADKVGFSSYLTRLKAELDDWTRKKIAEEGNR